MLVLAGCSTTPQVQELTAEQVVARIAETITTATPGVVFTAETDPNDLLGRPGGYTSKGSFTDSRINPDDVLGAEQGAVEYGGSVEVFDTEVAARKRKEYIDGFSEIPFAVECSYVDRPVLLRVSRQLTPDQAAEYQAALAEIS